MDQRPPSSHEAFTRLGWGAGIAIGMAVGVALGSAFDNMGLGIAIGLAIGIALMSAFMAAGTRSKRAPRRDSAGQDEPEDGEPQAPDTPDGERP